MCVELIATNCIICVELGECVSVHIVLSKLIEECGYVDPEHVAIVKESKILGLNEVICEDAVLKAVRLVRGGVST